jgi:hypothetical protein
VALPSAACCRGQLVQGVGAALYGSTDSITDYSIVQTDSFGVRSIVQRDYADDAEFQVQVDTTYSPYFRDYLASIARRRYCC